MQAADWPVSAGAPGELDADFSRLVTLRVRANSRQEEVAKRAVELDYSMKDGELKISVRAALENYLRSRLHLPLKGKEEFVPLLELIEDEPGAMPEGEPEAE